MTICIVVARYNEDMQWTKQFPNVKIYNKGESLENEYDEILLNNVGREGHTYYTHICNNYDNLDDYTIFLQGNPFDHSPNLLQNVNKYVNNPDLNIGFEFLSELIINCNLSGCGRHPGLSLIDVYEQLFNERKSYMELTFGAGAQFIVSKQNILKHPKSFYSKIVEILENSLDPIEGYVIERFHKMIFEK